MVARVIGLAGPIGCGKSTFALNLKSNLSNVQVMSFADGVRDALALVYDIPAEQWKDSQFKATPNERLGGTTPRRVLQLVATEGFRAAYPDTWVDYLERRLLKLPSGTVAVIDDVRFVNEANMISKLGGQLIYIESKEPQSNQSVGCIKTLLRRLGLIKSPKVHESESNFRMLQAMADYIVRNNWKVDLEDPDDTIQQQEYLVGRIHDLLDFLYEH